MAATSTANLTPSTARSPSRLLRRAPPTSVTAPNLSWLSRSHPAPLQLGLVPTGHRALSWPRCSPSHCHVPTGHSSHAWEDGWEHLPTAPEAPPAHMALANTQAQLLPLSPSPPPAPQGAATLRHGPGMAPSCWGGWHGWGGWHPQLRDTETHLQPLLPRYLRVFPCTRPLVTQGEAAVGQATSSPAGLRASWGLWWQRSRRGGPGGPKRRDAAGTSLPRASHP